MVEIQLPKVAVTSEISSLLQEGCVLTTRDLDEIASKHGFPSGQYVSSYLGSKFGTFLRQEGRKTNKFDKERHFYQVGEITVLRVRYKNHNLFTNADLPEEQTEWKEVIQNIDRTLNRKFRHHG